MMTTTSKIVRIDRAKWLTPDTVVAAKGTCVFGNVSALKNGSKMCCLGFWSNQVVGVPQSKLVGVALPSELRWNLLELSAEQVRILDLKKHRKFYHAAPKENDSTEIGKREREKRIRAIFKKAGYRAVFYGKYPKKKKLLDWAS